MRPGKIVLLIVGAIVGLVALGLVAGGAALVWASTTQRDAAGFFTRGPETFGSASYAVTSEKIDLGPQAADWIPEGLATVRIRATSSRPIFIGIGPSVSVDGYLRGVEHDVLTDVRTSPFEPIYRHVGGPATPPAPTSVSFWEAEASGTGTQTVTWEIRSGDWTIVLMNADGSRDVRASVTAGAKSPALGWISWGLLAFGLLLGAGATALILVSVVGGTAAGETTAPAAPARPGAYPVRLDGRLDPSLSRWLWLVKWFLAIPHLVVLAFLWAGVVVLTIVAFFSILFTGRYPRSIFDFNVGVMRWSWRVTFYAFALGTDRYPPFTLAADATYPADLDVAYPERLSNGLALVKWWLLAIPHYLVIALFGGFAFTAWRGNDVAGVSGLGLTGVLVLIAAVTLLFTGRYPQSIFDLVVGMYRWTYRVWAYAGLMRDDYPPFRLDMGGPDPGWLARAVPPPPMPPVDERTSSA